MTDRETYGLVFVDLSLNKTRRILGYIFESCWELSADAIVIGAYTHVGRPDEVSNILDVVSHLRQGSCAAAVHETVVKVNHHESPVSLHLQ